MRNPEYLRTGQSVKQQVEDPAKRRTLSLVATAGIAALVTILSDRIPAKGPDRNSYDQKQALNFIEQAKREGSVIVAEVINPDDPGEPVNSRQSPARLTNNFLSEVGSGEKIHGVVVTEITGYQDAADELPGTWFAFELPNGKSGFINTKFIEREDGQPLFQDGTKIYNTQTGKYIVLGQAQASR